MAADVEANLDAGSPYASSEAVRLTTPRRELELIGAGRELGRLLELIGIRQRIIGILQAGASYTQLAAILLDFPPAGVQIRTVALFRSRSEEPQGAIHALPHRCDPTCPLAALASPVESGRGLAGLRLGQLEENRWSLCNPWGGHMDAAGGRAAGAGAGRLNTHLGLPIAKVEFGICAHLSLVKRRGQLTRAAQQKEGTDLYLGPTRDT